MATVKRSKFGQRTTTKTLTKGDFGVENSADWSVIFIDEDDEHGKKVRHTLHLTGAERDRLINWLAYKPS